MKSIFFLPFLLTVTLFADGHIWSTKTPALTPAQSKQVIHAYEENNQTEIVFKDDPKVLVTSKIEANILVLGASIGMGSTSERIYNSVGEKVETYGHVNAKFTIGKDFTFWHEEYTQPTRIFATYTYTYLQQSLGYHTFTMGLEERMRYWSFFKTDKGTFYPTLSYQLGRTVLSRKYESIEGRTSELNTGVTYEHLGFEYFLTLAYNSITWQHPIEGIGDESTNYQMNLGVNYRFMYEDK